MFMCLCCIFVWRRVLEPKKSSKMEAIKVGMASLGDNHVRRSYNLGKPKSSPIFVGAGLPWSQMEVNFFLLQRLFSLNPSQKFSEAGIWSSVFSASTSYEFPPSVKNKKEDTQKQGTKERKWASKVFYTMTQAVSMSKRIFLGGQLNIFLGKSCMR